MTATEPDDGPIGEVPPAVLAYETRLDVGRAEIVRLTGATTAGDSAAWPKDAGEFAARWNAMEPQRRNAQLQLMVSAAEDAERCFLMAHEARLARADAAEARLRAVEALHKHMPADQLGGPHCHTDGLDWPCPTVAALSSDAAPQPRCSRCDFDCIESGCSTPDAAPQEVAQVRYADGEWSREYVEDDADPQEDGPDLAPLLAAAAAARAWRKRQSTREAVDRAVSGLRYEHYDEQDTHLGTCLLVSDLPVFLAALGIPVADAPAAPEGERS